MELDFVLLVSRWVHLAAAITAIGGAMFLRFALLPGAKQVLDEDQHRRLREAVRVRWVRWVSACIALLFLTGALNFYLLALAPRIEPIPYHAVFGIKLLAALFVFFLASALSGSSPGFASFRERSRKWLGVLITLAAVIVLLSGVLNQVRTRASDPSPAATSASLS